MEFFASAVDTLKVLVMAIGCGLGAWGIVNLLEGYLGLSAESTRFFHVSYAVYLTTRQPARTPFAEWWLYPAVAGHYHTCIFNVKRSVCVAVDRVWETERETLRFITK